MIKVKVKNEEHELEDKDALLIIALQELKEAIGRLTAIMAR